MESTTVVERFIREAWAGANDTAMAETVSSAPVRQIFELFNSAFIDVNLNELGPVFSDASESMAAAGSSRELDVVRADRCASSNVWESVMT
jgi:hypothetical protein